MGKVTIIIETEWLPSNILGLICTKVIPNEEGFQKAVMDETGVSPGNINISITPDPKEEQEY